MASADWELLERDGESAAIAAAIGEAGRGRVLLVEGAAGVGKSQLLAEVRTSAARAGADVLAARGIELERDFAFGVVRQLFEPLLTAADDPRRQALFAGPAGQARDVFALPGTAAGGPPTGDLAVLHGLYWLAANAAQDRPLVLAVDDLQWCDTASLRYLAYLLPRIEDLGVLLAAALRTGEPATDDHLLRQVTADPLTRVLQPRPLSPTATGTLLRQSLRQEVAPAFTTACHTATGGNPLLLRELARTVTARQLAPDADNAALVPTLGPAAVARLVALRTAGLEPTVVALARAVAVLGGRAPLPLAADLAGRDSQMALQDAVVLEARGVLQLEDDDGLLVLAFVHPLVLTAVTDAIDHAERARAHRDAARLLGTRGAEPERIATHLLHVPPGGDRQAVAALRAAAAQAAGRSAPESTYAYLRRALHEPPGEEDYTAVAAQAGLAALPVDLHAAARHLRQAHDRTVDPVARADIAMLLGTAHVYQLDFDTGLTVWERALAELPADQEERRRRLHAYLLSAATWLAPGRGDILARTHDLGRLPVHDSIGGRLLECAVATRESNECDPTAVSRARRALRDGSLVDQAAGDLALIGGWATLMCADDDEILMSSLDAAVEQAHDHGSIYALVPAYATRAITWLWRGHLAEAEQDAREALRSADLGHYDLGKYTATSWYAVLLMEQGRLDEAEQALRSIGVEASGAAPPGPVPMGLLALARLENLRGRHVEALAAARETGRAFEAYDYRVPIWSDWRAEAALALHALGSGAEARVTIAEQLRLARQWGTPLALGGTLRVTATVTPGQDGLDLLHEAVTVLDGSPARLEQAKTLAELGTVLLRSGSSKAARQPLRQALDLALRCGADPLEQRCRRELAAAGARPRRPALTGPEALTPSERRVAELAAQGHTNRHIAQRLFITLKTVELHLSASYRKLGITGRAHLPDALDPSTT
ncbi:ATP-binding protein [Streptomyces lavendulocolor]|uniref:ATP-binding protein n=1 Tax=Streptomyces lavendulocolor TaxID=67316 RepID=UPI003C3004CF